ncbi:MAG: tetratricopeptide repeat protein [Bdellovibrionaceae bacterium]|nr:tetratricopeptide repeat protein [Bdellovibrionales bacterium]MCB9085522.1 tetratricopeptide repeat protein [Pseudobdellovibrionaceae bacterium]
MNYSDNQDELLSAAKEHFKLNKYSAAEPLLNQLILRGTKTADIFHMLGTIYYDQGKFNKAIRAFRRALEIQPSFTDASIGLSIILNDLGRYDEGRKVFEEAQAMLDRQKTDSDPYINEKLAIKHDELGELYCRYGRTKEGLEQYFKALSLSARKPELTMKIAECFVKLEDFTKAIKELRNLVRDFPAFVTARIRLGQLFYDSGQVPEAVAQWEAVIQREPEHPEAKRLLAQAQSVEVTKNSDLLNL